METPHGWAPEGIALRFEPFFGRHSELAALEELLRTPGLVTVTGEPGIGKSALCRQALGSLEDRHDRQAKLVMRAGMTTESALREMLSALGKDPLPNSREGLEQGVTEAGIELIFLDQADRCREVAAETAAMGLDTGAFGVLASARWPLRVPGEREVRLTGLQTESVGDDDDLADVEAVRLFTDRFETLGHDRWLASKDFDLIASICSRLGGNPSEIRLAASLAALQGLAPVYEYLSASGNSVARGILDSLDPAAREAAIRLSTLCGDWTPAAAAAVSGLGDDVFQALQALSTAGVLWAVIDETGEVRFEIADSFFPALAQALTGSERMDAEALHMQFYADLVNRLSLYSSSDLAESLRRMRREYPNAVLALERAVACRNPAALSLVADLASFWQRERPVAEARALCLSALGLVQEAPRPEMAGRVLNVAATYHWMGGDYTEAKAAATSAYELFSRAGDTVGMAMAQSNRAIALKSAVDFQSAKLAAEEAVSLLRETKEVRRLIGALNNAGTICEDLGDFEMAAVYFQECIGLADGFGDGWSAMRAQSNLAEMMLHQGRSAEALSQYEACLGRSFQLNDPVTTALCLEGSAMAFLELGEPETTLALFEIGARVREDHGLPPTDQQAEFIREYTVRAIGILGSNRAAVLRKGSSGLTAEDGSQLVSEVRRKIGLDDSRTSFV